MCGAVTGLETSITGLASAATAGGSDVGAALQAQVSNIESSASTLASTVASVPAGSEDDPEIAAVQSAAEALGTSVTSLEATVTDVQNAASAGDTITALAGVATGLAYVPDGSRRRHLGDRHHRCHRRTRHPE